MTLLKRTEGDIKTSKVTVNQISRPSIDATIASPKSKRRMKSTRTTIIEREECSLYYKKQKGEVGNNLVTQEQSPTKRIPQSRKLNIRQEDAGSDIDFEKRDQLIPTHLQGPKRKRSREACNANSKSKTPTKPKKPTKAKNCFLPKLTNIREENSYLGPFKKNLVKGFNFSTISENAKNKSKIQSKELIQYKTVLSKDVKVKSKKKTINIGRSFDKMQTRETKLNKMYRVKNHRDATKKVDNVISIDLKTPKPHLLSGSCGLHSLINSSSSREVKNILESNVHNLETLNVKEEQKGTESNNCNMDIDSNDIRANIQSKEIVVALKLASNTSGYVRKTLEAVKDSKCISLKIREGISKRKKVDVNIGKNPDKLLTKVTETVAERYKSTLEALQSTQTLTAQKLIEELGAVELASKGNAGKVGKLGKRHIGRSMKTNFKKDGPTRREISKENAQSDVTNKEKLDTRHIKISWKTKKNKENQMKKLDVEDKDPENQGFTPKVAKKSKSLVKSGFDRLVSTTHGNKEFEIALAQILLSHNDELGWSKDQEKALQNAYLSKKQIGGDFWHLISKEVPERNAKECYDEFYSRDPTPPLETQEPTTKCKNENELPSSFSHDTKPKGASLKVTRKKKQLEAQNKIQNILRHVEDKKDYGISNSIMKNNHLENKQYAESVLDKMEDEKVVMLQSNPMKECNSVASVPHLEESNHAIQEKMFFENVVISGVSNLSDKENNQPLNAQDTNNKKLGAQRVELILKQVDNGEHFAYDMPKTISNTRKKKIIKTSNVYLHSKDALDFGDSTLDAIRRAKQELRNVFSRTGSRGGNFFDIETSQIAK